MKILIYILFSLPLLAQSLQENIEKYLAEFYPGCKNIVIELNDLPKTNENISLDRTRRLILGKGTALVPVLLQKNGKTTETFISTKPTFYYEAIEANRNINKKEILDSTFFIKKIVKGAFGNGKICSANLELNKYRSSSVIAKGEILKEECIERIPSIIPGDKILAEVKLNHVILTADAVAREQGIEGETIQIVCNNRIFKAKVIDSKKVQVE